MLNTSVSLPTSLAQAINWHHLGNVSQAEQAYRLILAEYPDQSDALHLLGVLMRQKGDLRLAINLMMQSISVNPEVAAVHFNLGNALRQMQMLQEALCCYEQAIMLDPSLAAAHSNRGDVLRQLDRREEAIRSYDLALCCQPSLTNVRMQCATMLTESGEHATALEYYDQIILYQPDCAEAFNQRGIVLVKLARYDDALLSYDTAIQIDRGLAEAHFNRGNACAKIGRIEEAIVSYDAAIALNPNFSEAFDNRGCMLDNLGRYEEALRSHNQALAINPAFAVALNNRGHALRRFDRFDEALICFEQAVRLKPNLVSAWNNRGLTLCDLRRDAEGLACYRRSLGIEPEYAETHFHLALHHLSHGRYRQGWREFEWRRHCKSQHEIHQKFVAPLWVGQAPLTGKSILLHAEQGYGDTIQFCRYAELVANKGATVLLQVPVALKSLLSTLSGVSQVFCGIDQLPNYDYHCPLMSLPYALNTKSDQACRQASSWIPNQTPYLKLDQERVNEWKRKLGPRTRPLVGLAWSGRADHDNDRYRSMTLKILSEIFTDQVKFVCLQKEIRDIDRLALHAFPDIGHFAEDLVNFSDTAALIANMDLVITVDTSIAHLAGAIGIPLGIMLPFNADWRWLRNRVDSPWYPSATLFRQSKKGDWSNVLRAVKTAIPLFLGIKVEGTLCE